MQATCCIVDPLRGALCAELLSRYLFVNTMLRADVDALCVCVGCVQAMERGIHFEILYSPTVRDSTFRQNTIANALQLVSACKGKVSYVHGVC